MLLRQRKSLMTSLKPTTNWLSKLVTMQVKLLTKKPYLHWQAFRAVKFSYPNCWESCRRRFLDLRVDSPLLRQKKKPKRLNFLMGFAYREISILELFVSVLIDAFIELKLGVLNGN